MMDMQLCSPTILAPTNGRSNLLNKGYSVSWHRSVERILFREFSVNSVWKKKARLTETQKIEFVSIQLQIAVPCIPEAIIGLRRKM